MFAQILESSPEPRFLNMPLDAFVLPPRRTKLQFAVSVLVSRFLNGCPMETQLEKDIVPESGLPEVRFYLEQCAQALEEVHAAGIVHCDVHPGNFCLDFQPAEKKPRVFTIDFGLAAYIKNQTRNAKMREPSFFGTPEFASLAAHKRRKQGFRDDLEALAYTFYHMLTGNELPWRLGGARDAKQGEQIRVSEKTRVPVEIRAFVLQCRALALDEMPQDYVAFVQALL